MADPNALYSYKGQEPRPLPHEIHYTEAWGGTNFRQGVESFTDEELIRAGYTGPHEMPSFDIEFQKIHWNSENCSYVVEDISNEELWENIRSKRNQLLAESDWTMLSDVPSINAQEWEKYRQRLRDITTEILDPKKVSWPIRPDKNDNFDLEPVIEGKLRWKVQDLEFRIEEIGLKVFGAPTEPLPDTNKTN